MTAPAIYFGCLGRRLGFGARLLSRYASHTSLFHRKDLGVGQGSPLDGLATASQIAKGKRTSKFVCTREVKDLVELSLFLFGALAQGEGKVLAIA